MWGFQRVSYDPNLMTCEKFSDDMRINEEGVDLGGPGREFLRPLMETLPGHQCLREKKTARTWLLTVLVMLGFSKNS